MTAAARQACFRLRDFDDTEVAKLLATSFAPIMYASSAEKMKPMAKSQSHCLTGMLSGGEGEEG